MERLKEIREKKGITLEEIAKVVKKSKVTVFNWENDINTIKVNDLIVLCKHLKVSADYLLGIDKREHVVNTIIDELETIDYHTVLNCIKDNLLNTK